MHEPVGHGSPYCSSHWSCPRRATATTFSDLFVFGDSLIDTGNVQAAAVGAGFDDPAAASFGYFEGRFANGLNLADIVNLAIEGTPLTGSLFGGDNYAFGGARARDNGDFVPDLGLQVGAHLVDHAETDACLLSGVADPTGPPTCAGFAFFDMFHPTAGTHAIFGGGIVDEFLAMDPGTNIPEPASAALLLLGLGAIASRRRA